MLFSEVVFTQHFEQLIKLQIIQLEGTDNSNDFFKTKWRSNEIVLNIPLTELDGYINMKKPGMSSAFQDFCDFF